MGVPDIQQAAKATDNFGLLKSSLEQCEVHKLLLEIVLDLLGRKTFQTIKFFQGFLLIKLFAHLVSL